MTKNRYPNGWDESRVREVLAHYEAQDEDQAVEEDEAAERNPSLTLMEIPNELVPEVRDLLARKAS